MSGPAATGAARFHFEQEPLFGGPSSPLGGPAERPSSVMMARDPEVLSTMLRFYAPKAQRIVDCTANARKMWKGLDTGRVTFCDIDPTMSPDIVADFRDLPFESASVDVLVFDPPHLPAAAASEMSNKDFAGRYGLAHGGQGSDISHFFADFLKEAERVLVTDGLIFAKLKDFVHNHAYRWTLADFINAVALLYLTYPSAPSREGAWQANFHPRTSTTKMQRSHM